MEGGKIFSWVEAHPAESAIIGVGGVLVIMWMLGFFSSSSSAASSGASNMAAAYYAAEAQQAVVGGQIQVANIQATAGTAQALAGDTAATDISAINANAATTINGQNANVTTTLGDQQLNATYSNNATLLATTQANDAAATQISSAHDYSSLVSSYMNSVLPTELATYGGGQGWATSIPGFGTIQSGGELSPAQAAAAGYGPNYLAMMGGA
jgi:hypothetical protein